jgi:cytochrome c oxidase cbb3-type subunit IV
LNKETAMDINVLRIAATLACFATFLGIMWWAFARQNRERFDEAARIPFDQD